jgi:hypothetical protein
MTENSAAAAQTEPADKQSTVAGRLRDEVLQMVREVSLLKLGSNLTSFSAPASMILPFSSLELLVFGTSFAAQEFAIALRHPDAALRMLHVLAGQIAALSQTLTAAMMKPYNPIIGEVLTAQSESEAAGGSSSSSWRIIAEQVSHHPPVTAMAVEGQADGGGSFVNRSSTACTPLFYGNYVKVAMNTNSMIQLTLPSGGMEEEYVITMFPSLYLRGVLGMGPQFCEWGGKMQIECVSTGLVGSIDFKTAGRFGSGHRHRIKGSVDVLAHNQGKTHSLYSISGAWNMRVTATRTGSKEELELIGSPDAGAERPAERRELPEVLPYSLPSYSLAWPRHSHQVWRELSDALVSENWALARAAKSKVEDGRRAEAAQMRNAGEAWEPAFFDGTPAAANVGEHSIWNIREDAFARAFNAEGLPPCRNL